MDIFFIDDARRKLCEDERWANRKLGGATAKSLRTRLADLRAAQSVRELVAGDPHPLRGDWAGQFSLRLHGGRRLVFEPANDPCPERPDGSVDWERVTRVRVVFIGDYHG